METSKKEGRFEAWVREHRSTIYTVCYMFSNDEQEVADLFQEVLINLWQGMDSFGGRSSVRTWVYHLRNQRRTEELLSDIRDAVDDASGAST